MVALIVSRSERHGREIEVLDEDGKTRTFQPTGYFEQWSEFCVGKGLDSHIWAIKFDRQVKLWRFKFLPTYRFKIFEHTLSSTFEGPVLVESIASNGYGYST